MTTAPTTIVSRASSDEFWRRVQPYRDINRATFLDHRWQLRQAAAGDAARHVAREAGSPALAERIDRAAGHSTMALRLTPYLLSLIDWEQAETDPLRRQFLPLEEELEDDHPLAGLDSLAETHDAPLPGLIQRHADRALLVATDTCPVFCPFCTRSYVTGRTHDERVGLPTAPPRWRQALDHIRGDARIEDVVLSGGDCWMLTATQLRLLGGAVLEVPHVRSMRVATRGPSALPMKTTSDHEWLTVLRDLGRRALTLDKRLMVHTHFNHPAELTSLTADCAADLLSCGIALRSQTVLLRGVNDDAAVLRRLFKELGEIRIEPYYVYQHDLVPGAEHFRTSLDVTRRIERELAGSLPGYLLPRFVVDVPGGAGKRPLGSFEAYELATGLSVWSAPSVKPGRLFVYGDPLRALPDRMRAHWRDDPAGLVTEATDRVSERPG